jgi:putative FmdB family regulatory protein
MPVYEYRCEKCGKVFSVSMSMDEHDNSRVTCPDCHSASVVRQYTPFFAKTTKKS